MASIVDRMIRASKLEPALYDEVEADKDALGQAMTVVIISSVAAGLGGIIQGGAMGLIVGIIAALVGWVIWAGLIYLIGTKLFPEPQTKSDIGELLRTLGFAASPGVFRVFAIIPILGWLIAFLAGIWMLVATVIAVRQALDYTSTLRAVGVCFVGWLVMVFIVGAVMAVFVGGAALTGDI